MLSQYTPIVRNGRTERRTFQKFSTSSLTGPWSPEIPMAPLYEVQSADDLSEQDVFATAGEFLMIDLPQYLTEEPSKYREQVQETIEDYGSAEQFYIDEASRIDVPVVSGGIDPVDYSEYSRRYAVIEDQFSRVGLRLFFKNLGTGLTDLRRDALEELAETIADEDIVIFDIIDNGVTDTLRRDLEYLGELFGDRQQIVCNVFNALNGNTENRTPKIADHIGADGFGDFGIRRRFNQDGGGGAGKSYIRHYHPNHATVEVFEGDGYQDAADDLTDWDDWDRGHCSACNRAERTNNADAGTWAEIRMNHYISSITAGEI